MDLFTYLMAKNDHNTSVKKDLFSYLLGKNQSGTYTDYSGTTISANNTKKAKMKLDLLGNTSQTGTPTPSTPIDVNVVSGDNEVVVCGKNLFNIQNATGTTGNNTFTALNQEITINSNSSGTESSFYLNDVSQTATYATGYSNARDYNMTTTGGTYTLTTYFSYKPANTFQIYLYTNKQSIMKNTRDHYDNGKLVINVTLGNDEYVKSIQAYTAPNNIFSNLVVKSQLEVGSATTYEPYQSQTYPINLPVENLVSSYSRVGNQVYLNGSTSTTNYIFKAGTYTISYKNNTNNTAYVFMRKPSSSGNENVDSGSPVTFTSNEDFNVWIYMSGMQDGDISEVQIEPGTKANHYTPYGTTPIELCKIGTYKDYFTKNSGKNMFDTSQAQIGKAWNNSSNSARAIVLTPVKPNTQYTISYVNSSVVDTLYWFDRVNENDSTYITANTQITQTTTTITTASTCNWLGIQFNKTNITQEDINKVCIMLKEGTTAQPYEPYGTGLWCKYNDIIKYTLNGTENWSIVTATHNNFTRYRIYSSYKTLDNLRNTNAFCNSFKMDDTGATTEENIIDWRTDGLIMLNTDVASTVDNLKTWLSSHNIIVYCRTTPYLSLIEDNNLIEQLDNLQNAMSYKGTTNINQVNNDLPFNIDAKIKVGN